MTPTEQHLPHTGTLATVLPLIAIYNQQGTRVGLTRYSRGRWEVKPRITEANP